MGTYIGLVIEKKLIISRVILRIVTTEDSPDEIVSFMQSENYDTITGDARVPGETSRWSCPLSTVYMFPVSQRTFNEINPYAFFSIEDVRYVNEGVFRPKKPNAITGLFHSFIRPRKKK